MIVIYYYHIPKCGGTTISNYLKSMAQKAGGEYWNYNYRMQDFNYFRKLKNDLKFRVALTRLPKAHTALRLVHHHHGYPGMDEIAPQISRQKEIAIAEGHQFYVFTCVRDPISFQKSRTNGLRNNGFRPNLTFDDVCEMPENQNVMSKYLLYNHHMRWRGRRPREDLIESALDIMDEVFTLDALDRLISWLEKVSGVDIDARSAHDNAGSHELIPTDEQIVALERANRLDRFLYDRVRQREME